MTIGFCQLQHFFLKSNFSGTKHRRENKYTSLLKPCEGMAATGPTQVFGQQMAADGTKGVPTFPKSHTEATTGNAAGGVSTGHGC